MYRTVYFHLDGVELAEAPCDPPRVGDDVLIENTMYGAVEARVTRVLHVFGDSDSHTSVARVLISGGPMSSVPGPIRVYLERIT